MGSPQFRHAVAFSPQTPSDGRSGPTDQREVLVTSTLDAVPESRHDHPGASIWPLLMALTMGVTFIGAIFTPWAYVVGFALASGAFAGWGWPRRPKHGAAPAGRPESHAESRPAPRVVPGRVPALEAP